MKIHHLKLAPSEQAVLNAAATIFSAFITSGQYQAGQEKEVSEKSINLAIMLAERIEETVKADDELA